MIDRSPIHVPEQTIPEHKKVSTTHQLQEHVYAFSVRLTQSSYDATIANEATQFILSTKLEDALQHAKASGEKVTDVFSTIEAIANKLETHSDKNDWTPQLKARVSSLREKFN